ncbi:hypothetical protein P8452_23939 [Trifolium repens]|nr:hypothetical protein P8452_23939 [Trifolium repens]
MLKSCSKKFVILLESMRILITKGLRELKKDEFNNLFLKRMRLVTIHGNKHVAVHLQEDKVVCISQVNPLTIKLAQMLHL